MENARERRSYIRIDKPIPVVLRIKTPAAIEEIKTQSRNISATGMMFQVEKNIPQDSSVELNLMPSDAANPIHIIAKIIRSEKKANESVYSIGVEFIKIEEDNKNSFLKFLCDTIYKV